MDTNELAVERRQQFYSNCAEYLKQLYFYVLSLTRNKTEAEELTQETFLLFLRFMDKRLWAADVRNIPAYLTTMAKHLYIDWRRRPREEQQMDTDDEQSEQIRKALERKAMRDNNPTARLDDDIYYKELYQSLPLRIILGGLSEYELRLLYMDAIDQMSTKEIAQAVGEDVDRVRYQLNKLYAKIRYRVRQFTK